jgi:hypothetical protein
MSVLKTADGGFFPAHIVALRVAGAVQPGLRRVLAFPEAFISYDVQVLEDEFQGILTNQFPVNRPGRNVKINSARVGTPCQVFLGPGLVELHLSGEEIPFNLCAPQGR